MNWKLDQAQDNRGLIVEHTFDLSKEKPRKYLVSPSLLMYSKISVEIVCVGCVGTSGIATIHETNVKNGQSTQIYTTAVTVALGVTTDAYEKVLNMMTSHIAIEFPVTIGVIGNMTVRIVGKD